MYTDWHCHLLPELDDGADYLAESLAMAGALVEAGYSTVYCTPHCMKGVFDTTTEQVREGVARLQAELDQVGINLRLLPGMEYYLDEYFPAELDRLVPLGNTKMVLVEVANQTGASLLKENIYQLMRRRYTPLIAHPERTPLLQDQDETPILDRFCGWFSRSRPAGGMQYSLLEELRCMGCLFQGNLGSLYGLYGPQVRKQAKALQTAGRYHCYGTDAHRAKMITEGISGAIPPVSSLLVSGK